MKGRWVCEPRPRSNKQKRKTLDACAYVTRTILEGPKTRNTKERKPTRKQESSVLSVFPFLVSFFFFWAFARGSRLFCRKRSFPPISRSKGALYKRQIDLHTLSLTFNCEAKKKTAFLEHSAACCCWTSQQNAMSHSPPPSTPVRVYHVLYHASRALPHSNTPSPQNYAYLSLISHQNPLSLKSFEPERLQELGRVDVAAVLHAVAVAEEQRARARAVGAGGLACVPG